MPNPPLTAKIIRIQQVSYLDALSKPQANMQVQFNVGDHGPFSVSLPVEGFTADAARSSMQATVDAVNNLSS